ncbi:MAG: Eco57I restriction-modification methylase domain-containing protein [Bacteroidia bacterium]|nr:Eco57I restriction-modification methylase domain-containing protein [Bacteroidia bacterium]
MQVNISDIRKSLNKAFLKVRPNRSQIETFKENIVKLLNNINESESEEFHKNLLSDFLKNTYYSQGHFINTRGRADLVIHTGKDPSSPVGVLFELKKPGAGSEMPEKDNPNSKAFSELILYYLRERFNEKNINIKHLIITNIYEWFIFSSNDFEKIFANSKTLKKDFDDFEDDRLAGNATDFFYKSVAEQFVNETDAKIDVTHFDIREYEDIIRNTDRPDDNKLIALYKIFTPEHLLNLSFSNDSNSLDRSFYSELLHIIGLEETKEGSKKLIGRKIEGKRDQGSLIENAINILKHEDCLAGLTKWSDYGTTADEQLYNAALELSLTWINRILFMKLLESQLVKYNSGDRSFRFLNREVIAGYDELNRLFFQVLAVKEEERGTGVKQKYSKIPFLNSSLFEPSELEHNTIRISSLEDNLAIPLPGNTVLKNSTGKKLTGGMSALEYLFRFLDAYDFSGEGSEEIQEENKILINASVLGLIFEKINGYKDGSFFTPGFITMYMCHETITRAVVQKFNEAKGWSCETINNVYNKITDIKEANRIVNSLKICDPAVGSGHFLVSALNEIIAIKSELGILADREDKRLKDYNVEVINDELVITGPDGEFFEYNPKNKESQRVQETLFREKEIIIENCLFGVDINPNSVKICRLRLWIELLKNAYYRQQVISNRHPTPLTPKGVQPATSNQQLETLPNIDINIKCGNSLISRYPLDADIKSALKSARWNVDNYREAIMTYRNAPTKEVKRNMEELIEKIKSQFETEVAKNDKRFMKLYRMTGELAGLTDQGILFDKSKKEKYEWNKKVKKLTEEMQKVDTEIAEIKSNKIYENAFEWRFEFPEVLNNDGDFVGFDVVIGNPPYVVVDNSIYRDYKTQRCSDLYCYFIELALLIVKNSYQIGLITPSLFLKGVKYDDLRSFLLNYTILKIDNLGDGVFIDVQMPTAISFLKKSLTDKFITWENILDLDPLIIKISTNSVQLKELVEIHRGIEIGKDKTLKEGTIPVLTGEDIGRYYYTIDKYISGQVFNLFKKDENYFSGNRLVIRETGSNISATFLYEKIISNRSLYSIKSDLNKIDLKYLLGILNSRLLQYVYTKKFKAETDVFPKIRIVQVKQLPIALSDSTIMSKISTIVDIILNQKILESSYDTTSLESEIDRLVYEMYGLTEEEIKIVDGKMV